MTEGKGGYIHALKHKDLRTVFVALVVSDTCSWSYTVALAVYAYEETHSAAWVAAASLGRFLPALAFSAYAGVLAERFERVRVMVTSDVIAFIVQGGLALVAFAHGSVLLAIVLAAVSATVQVVYPPAVAAMVPQLAGEDDLVAANAIQGSIDNLVVVVGPAFGALLLLAGSVPLVFAVNAASFALSALLVRSIGTRSKTTDVTEGGSAGPLKQMKAGFVTIVHSPAVALLVSFSVAASFIYGADTVLFAPISKLQLGTGANGYGYLLAGCGLGGLVAAGSINKLAVSPRLSGWIVGGLICYCLPTTALIFVHQPVVAFVIEVIRGGGTIIVDVLAVTALQRTVTEEMLSRVFGVFFTLVLAAISLGALITAPLLDLIELRGTLVIFGAGVSAVVLASYPWVRRVDASAMVDAKQVSARVLLLQEANIFHAASRIALERLARNSTVETVDPGTVIVREGDPADAFYVIQEGEVEVIAKGEAGEERHIRHLGAGDYFGEIGLLGRIPRSATVRATQPCNLLEISGDMFISALTDNPPAALLLQGASARLSLTHPSKSTLISERHPSP